MNENKEYCMSIDNATLKILQEIEENMNKACIVVERTAKQNVHVDMGILRASITHDVKATTQLITGSVFSNENYAPFVEKGTGVYAVDGNGRMTPWSYLVKVGKYKGWHTTDGQKPRPFLEPARDKHKEDVINMLGGKK